MQFADYLKWYKDFPKPGINFCDVFPLLEERNIAHEIGKMIGEKYYSLVDDERYSPIIMAGIEARGFMVAALLAGYHSWPIVPIRKGGKLPGNIVSQNIRLEYGEAVLEMAPAKKNGREILLVDDVLATGGTLDGAKILAEKAGFTVLGAVVIVNLLDVPKSSDYWNAENLISLINI